MGVCSQLGTSERVNPINPRDYPCPDPTSMRKKCSIDQEKHLKFEVEGREFSKFLKSLEQFIQTVKGQNNFW